MSNLEGERGIRSKLNWKIEIRVESEIRREREVE